MRLISWIAIACAVLGGCDDGEAMEEDAGARESADGGVPDSGFHADEPMRVLAPGETYAGKSLEEWAIEYLHWSYSQTTCDNPISDRDGSHCSLKQEDSDSPVFFFERSDYGDTRPITTTRTECSVPVGKAILVPVSVYIVDNAEVETPRSDAKLQELAADVQDSIRSLLLEADGVSIADLRERAVGPTRSSYSLPPPDNYFSCTGVDGVGDTTIEPAYIAGVFALFEPPASGMHEVEYAGLLTERYSDYSYDVKAKFRVEEPP